MQRAEKLRREAEKLRIGRDYEGALRMFEEVYRLDPANAKGNWGIGRIYLENGQPHDALPFLRRAASAAYASRGEPELDLKRARRRSRRDGIAKNQLPREAPASTPFSETISDFALSIMLLDLGVCLGETADYSEQVNTTTYPEILLNETAD